MKLYISNTLYHTVCLMILALTLSFQTVPKWFSIWKRDCQKEEKVNKQPDLERKIKWLEKEKRKLETKYIYAAQQGGIYKIRRAEELSRFMEDKVSAYAFSQARASLDGRRQTVSVPHPQLGEVEVPLINGNFYESLKAPVHSKDLILKSAYGEVEVFLKRRPTVCHAVAEYFALTKLSGSIGFPQIVGMHHAYSETFVVTKAIPTDCEFVTLRDAMYGEVFKHLTVIEWRNIMHGIWQRLDQIHSMGYLHNNLVAENVVLSISDHVCPYLVGFSLFCHSKDAIKVFHKHDAHFASTISHLHPDVRFGRTQPSFASDVYCYGQLLMQLHRAFVLLMDSTCPAETNLFWKRVHSLACLCVKHNPADIPCGRELASVVHKHFSA